MMPSVFSTGTATWLGERVPQKHGFGCRGCLISVISPCHPVAARVHYEFTIRSTHSRCRWLCFPLLLYANRRCFLVVFIRSTNTRFPPHCQMTLRSIMLLLLCSREYLPSFSLDRRSACSSGKTNMAPKKIVIVIIHASLILRMKMARIVPGLVKFVAKYIILFYEFGTSRCWCKGTPREGSLWLVASLTSNVH
jgi:hypothetical protein